MDQQAPLNFTFYIAASPEKVWDGFVSRESKPVSFFQAQIFRQT